ncbi:hypothetical protein HFP51_00745 [Parasphingopyxis sp. CP4]|uniref:ComEC/Rec2 family competence protein n=1 Tax=Parasphingopyxis sp. CP4 TaxID=2724527 RepID=UPI00159FC3CF|nr:MBL fold metallo-hydrolase [Parasphingopyxis sp. CP4]QLC20840.1 hypothetical protein HFP51_00745 [Parasphingopyxis sp. CP4]
MPHKFVGLRDDGKHTHLYDAVNGAKVREVLWGDWLTIDGPPSQGWQKVIWSPNSPTNRRELFIPEDHLSDDRPLEIIFLDVGQGDGAILITPETDQDERVMVIDAGIGDNMHRFLRKRFGGYRSLHFDAAVLTHPDEDHYGGFKPIFDDSGFRFKKLYHNGLIERAVSGSFEKIGGKVRDDAARRSYVTDIRSDRASVDALYPPGAPIDTYEFPPLMRSALAMPGLDFEMLSTSHGVADNGRRYVPGFAPADAHPYQIEILAPVCEFDANGDTRLRVLGSSYGKTKNGHSVILQLQYKDFSVLFGGDLNSHAEKYLLMHYAGIDDFPDTGTQDYEDMIEDAGARWRSDIMKVCHHGASDVTDAFLETVNPACFIISSGDEEGHVHPRPDLLGRLGRFGRGKAPVLLSTELQRSSREREDAKLIERVNRTIAKTGNGLTANQQAKLREDIRSLAKVNVDVYGAIYLKSDGDRLITAFKIEQPSLKKRWFWFEYKFDSRGRLSVV